MKPGNRLSKRITVGKSKRVTIFKRKINKDLERRVKKSHIEESRDAKHDILAALRVAMRRMIDEAVQLTELNMH